MPKPYKNPYGRKKTKYGANKTTIDGITFDSKREAKRYSELKAMERVGKIHDLRLQEKYILIPTQREPDTIGKRGGIIKGKLLEREVAYYADFVYKIDGSEKPIVEDTKGMKTKEYIIKRKLMLYIHKIKIKEI